MKSNPWVASYLVSNAPDRYSQLERRAVVLRIKGDSVIARSEVLRDAMSDIFLCGEQISLLLDKLLAIAEGHALNHYDSSKQVLESLYSLRPWGETRQPAIMLTGLAGTGKTQLLLAMKRFFCDRVGSVELPRHGNLEILPAWFMSLKDGNTLNALIGPCVDPESADKLDETENSRKKDLKQSQLLKLASRVSRRDGVCIIFLDEFQFISRSLHANALAISLLLQMISIGPRVVYVANFSLARRLMNRRQEDRQRVLGNPLELRPDDLHSSDFRNYFSELIKVSPEDFKFDVAAMAELIHRYTYGIKRALVELIVGAWVHAKSRRGDKADVTESDVRAAYASSGYLTYRTDVEALWRYSVGDKNIDQDLLNPFSVESATSNIVIVEKAINSFNQRINERHVESMLTPFERDAFSKLAPPAGSATLGGTVRPLRKGAESKEALLSAFERVAKDL